MTYDTEAEYESDLDALEESEPFEFELESGETSGEQEQSLLSESEEMELAADLLEITDEDELDQFIGKLFKKAASAVRRVVKSPIGQKLRGLAKGAIRKALPKIGAAVGGYFAPGIGAGAGAQAGSHAAKLLGLELERLSEDEQELEVAKHLVRLLTTSAQHAAAAPSGGSPIDAARQAFAKAARRHAPGLLRKARNDASDPQKQDAGEYESEPEHESEGEGQSEGESDSPFNEIEEMELAAELVGVTEEEELDQFIGSLLKRAARSVGKVLKTPIGQQVGGLIKARSRRRCPASEPPSAASFREWEAAAAPNWLARPGDSSGSNWRDLARKTRNSKPRKGWFASPALPRRTPSLLRPIQRKQWRKPPAVSPPAFCGNKRVRREKAKPARESVSAAGVAPVAGFARRQNRSHGRLIPATAPEGRSDQFAFHQLKPNSQIYA